MKVLAKAIAAVAVLGFSWAAAETDAPALVYHPWPDEELDEEASTNIDNFLGSLSPQQGEIGIDKAHASLNVPETHYFLDAKDAQAVLVDAWGNPPDDGVLGMIFPAGASPLDYGVWGATISYNSDGYVSDEDANKIDYDDLLSEIQQSQNDNNQWREDNGYDPIEIVGWAENPSYNPDTHKLYWAKELKFGDQEVNTLNYDIRVLGRRGTLVISFIATMNELSDIRSSSPAVLEMAKFNPGATYAEYQPGVDKKAAYGIAGLIGGAAIAKKTGLLAALFLFGKKLIVFILVGLAAMFGAVKRFFSGGK